MGESSFIRMIVFGDFDWCLNSINSVEVVFGVNNNIIDWCSVSELYIMLDWLGEIWC